MATVMDGANQLGIYIPHFCYHKKLSIAANCRMCLVQVEKAPKPLPACATPAMEGMKVSTHSGQAVTAQKGVMEFLLINHPLDCPICDQGGECQLQDLAVGYGSSSSRYTEAKRVVANKNLGPLISTDMTRCIHCTRCVRFGQEIAGIMELGHGGPRRACGDPFICRQYGGFGIVGQHDRSLSGRCAGQQAIPLFGAYLGTITQEIREPALRSGFQPCGPGEAEPRNAGTAARERGNQRMLDIR